MPKLEDDFSIIKEAVSMFSNGASIEDIRKIIGTGLELRTLQRRLKFLAEKGELVSTGARRGMRYHLPPQERIKETISTPAENNSIHLSEESKDIRSYIRQPVAARRSAGYNAEFLTAYRPNIDSYLDDAEKKKLLQTGNTGSAEAPAGTYAKEILSRLLIDLSWNSSRLEGNTYSLLDTERLIALGEPATGKPATDAQMILNHKDAIEFIVQDGEEIGFNRYTILNLHALLSNNLLPNPAASGRLRSFGVGIHGSAFTPLNIPQRIEEIFELLLQKAAAIQNPFEKAFFILVQLPYLQPFDDVNKRVSRLAANIPFNRHNLSPLSFTDVPADMYAQALLGVYELNKLDLMKDLFLWAYERSAVRYAAVRQSVGEPDLFRLKYRTEMRNLVTQVIAKALPIEAAGKMVESTAAGLPEQDRAKFIETIETELLSLHEGNFARYFVSPAEFSRWKEGWLK
jgi:hypothetical protein